MELLFQHWTMDKINTLIPSLGSWVYRRAKSMPCVIFRLSIFTMQLAVVAYHIFCEINVAHKELRGGVVYYWWNWIGWDHIKLWQHLPLKLYVVRHYESHIMSGKKYLSFWQIWILQILSFKSIYNLPYFIVRKIQKNDRKLYGPIWFSKHFSCFLGFYDLRLYTGNVITHHICHLTTDPSKVLKSLNGSSSNVPQRPHVLFRRRAGMHVARTYVSCIAPVTPSATPNVVSIVWIWDKILVTYERTI